MNIVPSEQRRRRSSYFVVSSRARAIHPRIRIPVIHLSRRIREIVSLSRAYWLLPTIHRLGSSTMLSTTVDGGDKMWTTLYRSTGRIARAATVAKPTSSVTTAKSSCVLVDEYASHSTVHGMRYMNRAGFIEK